MPTGSRTNQHVDDLEEFADFRPPLRNRNLKSEPHVLCLKCQYLVSGSDLLLDLGRRGAARFRPRNVEFEQEAKKAFKRANGSIGLSEEEPRHHLHLQHIRQEEKLESENPPIDATGQPVINFGNNTPSQQGDNRPGFCGHVAGPPVETKTETIMDYAQLVEIRNSATVGCHLCKLIYQSIVNTETYERCYYRMGYIQLKVKYPVYGDCGTGSVQTAGHLYCDAKPDGRVSLTISEPGRDRNLSMSNNITIRSGSSLYASTASDAHFDLARSWLQRCITGHRACRDEYSIAESPAVDWYHVLPTRLLDLRSLHTENGRIRLCKTRDLGEVPQYVALSHCWGSIKPLLLTDATENRLFEGIQGSEFPATLMDAILISRKLDFLFLWIDSLCIKQDSVEDWERESAIMGDIYRNCSLNVSALWAKDSRDGCFSTRNPLLRRPCSLEGDEEIGIFASIPKTLSQLELEHDRGLLCTRGWVFQERYLSPRTLYYGAEGISWECRTVYGNEETGLYTISGKYPLRPKKEMARLENPKKLGLDAREMPKFNKDLGESWYIHEKWIGLVNYYTGCSLTYSSDRLVALSGIIRSIAERTGLRNVAGLWTDCIVLELMWTPNSATRDLPDNSLLQSSSESKVFEAPSWSWVSLGSQVEYIFGASGPTKPAGAMSWTSLGLEINFEMTLIEAVVEAKPNGQLISAHLDIYGQI